MKFGVKWNILTNKLYVVRENSLLILNAATGRYPEPPTSSPTLTVYYWRFTLTGSYVPPFPGIKFTIFSQSSIGKFLEL